MDVIEILNTGMGGIEVSQIANEVLELRLRKERDDLKEEEVLRASVRNLPAPFKREIADRAKCLFAEAQTLKRKHNLRNVYMQLLLGLLGQEEGLSDQLLWACERNRELLGETLEVSDG